MSVLLAAACAGVAVALLHRPRSRLPHRPPPVTTASAAPRRVPRSLLAAGAGLAVALFLGGPAAPVLGLLGAGLAWWLLGRAEPAAVRREREAAVRDLPHLVHLLAAALRSGAAPGDAVRLVCAALPGPAAERLAPVPDRLALGVEPARVWGSLVDDEALAPLGRAMARASDSGAPVVASVERLADDLERTGRSRIEDRARAVGVRAALPLGLCLLPSFLLLGIVPLVAGLLSGIAP